MDLMQNGGRQSAFDGNCALLPLQFPYVAYLDAFGGKHFSYQNGKCGSEISCTNYTGGYFTCNQTFITAV